MTESEYKTVVKLMIEKLDRCKDEIAEKDAEIERLKDMVGQNEGVLPEYEKLIKINAIKEFAERLKGKKEKQCAGMGMVGYTVWVEDIDETVKEMVGGNDE